MQWTFGNYRLDCDNAALWRDGEQVALRPKTFDVLRFLVEHAGDLVRKETLLEEVWKDRYVVEGVLTTSMSELRKLFGDTGKQQRFIATVYRRGYRFIAAVEQAGPAPQPRQPAAATPVDGAVQRSGAALLKFPQMRGFVGRESECERLVNLLARDSDCRILTLVGPGGIGKTRLALTVVKLLSELDDHGFDDGIYAVALQSLHSSDDIHTAIAEALELQYSGDIAPRQHIQDYLQNKRLLLLLDNFEHLLSQAPALAEIIHAAPAVKILLTSRESLPLADAWFHPVAGLDYGDRADADADAVRLFAQVARRNQADFDIEEKLPAVQRICRMVEGMPLALELAAAWLKMLSVDEVADEIEKGIDILADQQGGHDARHRSVRAVIIETWQRLTDDERSVLQHFSVFRGGADRAAITEVIGAGLPLLAQLVNKALLRSNERKRYRMHELIRQFAAEELAADADSERQARQRHAGYYLGWLERQLPRLRSAEQGDACRDIQADIDNIRSAWRWAATAADFEMLRGGIRALSLFSDLRGHFQDGLAMFELARQRVGASDHPERDELLAQLELRCAMLNFRLSRYETALGLFLPLLQSPRPDYERALALRFLGDYHFSHAGHCTAAQGRQYLDECIQLCEKLGDTQLQTSCLCELAILYGNLDIDIEASQRYAAQSVALARITGRPDLLAASLDVLAWTTNHRGDYAAAEALWREVFDIAHGSGNRADEALAVNWLGWSAWSVGGERHDEAARYFSDALRRYRELGDRANQAMSHADLASVLLESGELEQAAEHCRQGLELARAIGREDHYVYNLYTLGAVECEQAKLKQARARLREALRLAWEQEEETNKPAVLYYIARLFYAEYRAQGDAGLDDIGRLLSFLQSYPPTWQTFKDRAQRLAQSIESETGTAVTAPFDSLAADDLIAAVMADIPELLN